METMNVAAERQVTNVGPLIAPEEIIIVPPNEPPIKTAIDIHDPNEPKYMVCRFTLKTSAAGDQLTELAYHVARELQLAFRQGLIKFDWHMIDPYQAGGSINCDVPEIKIKKETDG